MPKVFSIVVLLLLLFLQLGILQLPPLSRFLHFFGLEEFTCTCFMFLWFCICGLKEVNYVFRMKFDKEMSEVHQEMMEGKDFFTGC